jgi:salicylate hydroxylase
MVYEKALLTSSTIKIQSLTGYTLYLQLQTEPMLLCTISQRFNAVSNTSWTRAGHKGTQRTPFAGHVRPVLTRKQASSKIVKMEAQLERQSREKRMRVAIVGAGICGLATAVVLHRKGLDVSVYDRATALKQNAGTGLALFPNGLQALRLIDQELYEAVKDAGSVVKGVAMINGSNSLSDEPLQAFPSPMQATYGEPMVCIRWGALQSTLASFLPPECLNLDSGLRNFTVISPERGVNLQLARRDGTLLPVVEADLLIACDGIRSVVRETLLSDGPPSDLGRVIWRGIVHRSDVANVDSFFPEATTCIGAMGPSRTLCFMDVGDGMYWAAGALDGAFNPDVDLAGGAWAQCRDAFKDVPDALACLDATPPEKVFASRVIDRPPTFKTNFSGPVTLSGDALHPVTPSFGQVDERGLPVFNIIQH